MLEQPWQWGLLLFSKSAKGDEEENINVTNFSLGNSTVTQAKLST